MSELTIQLENEETGYRPGERVRGKVTWSLSEQPSSAELRLFWRTQGKGDEDLEVAKCISFDIPSRSQTEAFEFDLPTEPYSFSGKLISLIWSLELSVMPSDDAVRSEITISPTREEIRL